MSHLPRTLVAVVLLAAPSIAAEPTLLVPASDRALHVAVPLSGIGEWPEGARGRLVSGDGRELALPVDVVPDIQPDGSSVAESRRLVATIPAGVGDEARRFRLERADDAPTPAFRFGVVDAKGLGVWEGDRPVLVYNHGIRGREGVPPERNRSTYVHPIYGLDGEVLTDDFPEDHVHQRGLFWAWPHVIVDGQEYDLWLAGTGLDQRFERWLAREAGASSAVLGVENGWYIGDRKVLQERIWLTVHPAVEDSQAIDIDCYWTPMGGPISLAGAEGKSYGGMSLRFAPRTGTAITTPAGTGPDDLLITHLPWADLTAQFDGAPGPSGAALFVDPRHPDFPPEWMTRHYGILCVGWPGITARTIEPDSTVRCPYRVWIHRDAADASRLGDAYDAMAIERAVTWDGDPGR